MPEISKRFKNIAESQTVALSGLLAKMQREGKDIVTLGAGEPDFDTPQHIKDAAIQAIQQGFTKYTPADGSLDLKDAIAAWLLEQYQAEYDASEIIITSGGKHAVYQAICAVCDPGDEVLLPKPYWVSYPEQIKLPGAVVCEMESNEKNKLKITAKQLKNSITNKTKLLILNSPNNPSGAVYSEQELDEIADVIRETGIYILSDEIYDNILYDNLKFTSFTKYKDLKDQLLLVNGVSKSFAMTGWRIGFLAANKNVAAAVKKYQGHSTSNPASISQKAAFSAYKGSKDFIQTMNKAFTERRDYVCGRLNAIPNVTCNIPDGAFYAFPEISAYFGKFYNDIAINSSVDLCRYLLEKFNVAIVPGIAFGMDKHVRLSFATSMDVLKKALDRIENGLLSLK